MSHVVIEQPLYIYETYIFQAYISDFFFPCWVKTNLAPYWGIQSRTDILLKRFT